MDANKNCDSRLRLCAKPLERLRSLGKPAKAPASIQRAGRYSTGPDSSEKTLLLYRQLLVEVSSEPGAEARPPDALFLRAVQSARPSGPSCAATARRRPDARARGRAAARRGGPPTPRRHPPASQADRCAMRIRLGRDEGTRFRAAPGPASAGLSTAFRRLKARMR